MKKILPMFSVLLIAFLFFSCDLFFVEEPEVFYYPALTAISINEVPTTKDTGDNWDPDGSTPDTYFELRDSSNLVILSSSDSYFSDPASFPVSWVVEGTTFDNLGELFYITIWDYDPFDANDQIGSSGYFKFQDCYRSATYTIQLATDCSVTLSLSWIPIE
jgi:hypothetical protein